MVLIVIIACIATTGFYRRAKQIGIHPGKAASVPFIGAGLMIAFTYLAAMVIGRFLANMNVSVRTASWIGFSMDWFLILSYGLYIKRNWDVLCASRRLPNDALREP